MSRKLNSISLQHNCIPATCCCGDTLRGEGTTRDWERRFRVAKSQPHRAVLHYRQGRLQQACISHLTCFALSLHDTRHTHQVKHRILRIYLEDAGMHWAPALGKRTAHELCNPCICTRKASWDEQGTSSRRVHTTLLRAELPGVGTGDHDVWEFNEGQESPCSPPSFACHDEVMVPAA